MLNYSPEMLLPYEYSNWDCTVCPRSIDRLYIEIYYIKWAKTSWTYSMYYLILEKTQYDTFYKCMICCPQQNCGSGYLLSVIVFFLMFGSCFYERSDPVLVWTSNVWFWPLNFKENNLGMIYIRSDSVFLYAILGLFVTLFFSKESDPDPRPWSSVSGLQISWNHDATLQRNG